MKIKPCPKCGSDYVGRTKKTAHAWYGDDTNMSFEYTYDSPLKCNDCGLTINDKEYDRLMWNMLSDYANKEREFESLGNVKLSEKSVMEILKEYIKHECEQMTEFRKKLREDFPSLYKDEEKELKPVNEACLGKKVLFCSGYGTNGRQHWEKKILKNIEWDEKIFYYSDDDIRYIKFNVKRCPGVVYGDEDD